METGFFPASGMGSAQQVWSSVPLPKQNKNPTCINHTIELKLNTGTMSNKEFIPFDEQLWSNMLQGDGHNKGITKKQDLPEVPKLQIIGKGDLPTIGFNPDNGHLMIKGRCCPKDPSQFFEPLLIWTKAYCLKPQPHTKLILQLSCFNTQTSVFIMQMIGRLEELQENGHQVELHWHIAPGDTDMQDQVKIFRKLCHVPMHVTDTIKDEQ